MIVGKDLVPRLSFQSVMLLKENMKKLLRGCKLPKYQILGSGICSLCVKDWKKRLHTTSGNPGQGGDHASDEELMSPSGAYFLMASVSREPEGVENIKMSGE